MIPAELNVDDIVARIKYDAVSVPSTLIHGDSKSSQELQQDLSAIAEDTEALGNIKIILVNDYFKLTELRDTAQAVKDKTGANTVLVQSPNTSAAVSDKASRYTIEKNQRLVGGYNHREEGNDSRYTTEHTVKFLEALSEPEPTFPVNASGLTVAVVATLFSVWAARKFYPNS